MLLGVFIEVNKDLSLLVVGDMLVTLVHLNVVNLVTKWILILGRLMSKFPITIVEHVFLHIRRTRP